MLTESIRVTHVCGHAVTYTNYSYLDWPEHRPCRACYIDTEKGFESAIHGTTRTRKAEWQILQAHRADIERVWKAAHEFYRKGQRDLPMQ